MPKAPRERERERERNSGENICRHGRKTWRTFREKFRRFAEFRPLISRRSGRKKFHEKLSTISASRETKFFHRETLGAWGHKKRCGSKLRSQEIAACVLEISGTSTCPSEKNKGGWKTQGRGKHTIKPLPQNGLDPPPPMIRFPPRLFSPCCFP